MSHARTGNPLAAIRRAIGEENPVFVQMLGLCPLLAVSVDATAALALGLATAVTIVMSNAIISVLARWIPTLVRVPCYVLVIASAVSLVDLILEAYRFDLHRDIGLFVPLIVTNCLILARAEMFASRRTLGESLYDGVAMGAAFALALTTIGVLREVIGQGSVFVRIGTLWPNDVFNGWRLFSSDHGWLYLQFPAGAFLLLAVMIAAFRALRRTSEVSR